MGGQREIHGGRGDASLEKDVYAVAVLYFQPSTLSDSATVCHLIDRSISDPLALPMPCCSQSNYLQTQLMARFTERLLKLVAEVSRQMPEHSDRQEHRFPHLAGSHLTQV